ncbi:hypothetical protein PLESTB_000335000 [Pleodorina starrii]|uniref:Uncharacterized protein n=1 Tax=Pleodorina starrii TaxID=330485 RepID=A0A9W6BEC6_9CHLO|nr:hypothetical protein PLESTB_000335000 [Pleodorina starrii]
MGGAAPGSRAKAVRMTADDSTALLWPNESHVHSLLTSSRLHARGWRASQAARNSTRAPKPPLMTADGWRGLRLCQRPLLPAAAAAAAAAAASAAAAAAAAASAAAAPAPAAAAEQPTPAPQAEPLLHRIALQRRNLSQLTTSSMIIAAAATPPPVLASRPPAAPEDP